MGRARPAGHLDHRLRDSPGAPRAVRGSRVPDGRGTGRARPGTGAHHRLRSAAGAARERAGCRGRLQRRDLPLSQAPGPPDVADHRSAGRPDSRPHARGATAAGRLPRVSARAAATHRRLPEQPARAARMGSTDRRQRGGPSRRRSIRSAPSIARTIPKTGVWESGACRPACPTSGARPGISSRSCSRRAAWRSSTTRDRARGGSASSR